MEPTTRNTIESRQPVAPTAARVFKDYTVHAVYPDGSTMPIATVDDFADVADAKAAHRSAHAGTKYRVVERDVDESRNPVIIESEVK